MLESAVFQNLSLSPQSKTDFGLCGKLLRFQHSLLFLFLVRERGKLEDEFLCERAIREKKKSSPTSEAEMRAAVCFAFEIYISHSPFLCVIPSKNAVCCVRLSLLGNS